MNCEINYPLLSIITVCYNAEKEITETILSVQKQNCNYYEHLILDGASKDGTLKLIKEYAKSDKRIKFYSEQDTGIYDAMNKGIKKASGKFLLFLNAGDYLCEGVLDYLFSVLKNNQESKLLIYGDSVNYYIFSGNLITKTKKANKTITTKSLRNGMGVVHQSIIASKAVFSEIGNFDCNYSIGADWDWFIRAVISQVPLLYIEIPIVYFSTEGISSSVHNWQRHLIRKKNKLYKCIDMNYIKDVIEPSNMIKHICGIEKYQKFRALKNKIQNKINPLSR